MSDEKQPRTWKDRAKSVGVAMAVVITLGVVNALGELSKAPPVAPTPTPIPQVPLGKETSITDFVPCIAGAGIFVTATAFAGIRHLRNLRAAANREMARLATRNADVDAKDKTATEAIELFNRGAERHKRDLGRLLEEQTGKRISQRWDEYK